MLEREEKREMGAFDDVLNIGIPALLIIITLGFLWVKFIEPWVLPMLARMWGKITESTDNPSPRGKEIVYDS